MKVTMSRRKIWAVVGESRTNADGRRRQDILCDVEPGDAVDLIREIDNEYDANAVAVRVSGETVGYIGREDAVELAPLLDAGRSHRAIVHSIRGGVPGYPSYGCQISIAWMAESLIPSWRWTKSSSEAAEASAALAPAGKAAGHSL